MVERHRPGIAKHQKTTPPLGAESKPLNITRNKFSLTISEITFMEARGMLHMGGEEKPISVAEQPSYRASKIAQDYLSSFFRDDKSTGTNSMALQVKSWAEDSFKKPDKGANLHFRNAAIAGIILMINVFETEYGSEFIDNLRNIKAKEVKKAFDEARKQLATKKISVIERSQNKNIITGNQDKNLLYSLVEELADLHSEQAAPHVEAGAALGVGVINRLWPKLMPQGKPGS